MKIMTTTIINLIFVDFLVLKNILIIVLFDGKA